MKTYKDTESVGETKVEGKRNERMELRFTEAGQLEEGSRFGAEVKNSVLITLFEMPVRHCMVKLDLWICKMDLRVWSLVEGPSWRSNMGNH